MAQSDFSRFCTRKTREINKKKKQAEERAKKNLHCIRIDSISMRDEFDDWAGEVADIRLPDMSPSQLKEFSKDLPDIAKKWLKKHETKVR